MSGQRGHSDHRSARQGPLVRRHVLGDRDRVVVEGEVGRVGGDQPGVGALAHSVTGVLNRTRGTWLCSEA